MPTVLERLVTMRDAHYQREIPPVFDAGSLSRTSGDSAETREPLHECKIGFKRLLARLSRTSGAPAEHLEPQPGVEGWTLSR